MPVLHRALVPRPLPPRALYLFLSISASVCLTSLYAVSFCFVLWEPSTVASGAGAGHSYFPIALFRVEGVISGHWRTASPLRVKGMILEFGQTASKSRWKPSSQKAPWPKPVGTYWFCVEGALRKQGCWLNFRQSWKSLSKTSILNFVKET